jgi:TonB family protein
MLPAPASQEPAATDETIADTLTIAAAPAAEPVATFDDNAPAIDAPVAKAPAAVETAPEFKAALLLKPPRPTYPDRCSAKAREVESVTIAFTVGVDGAVSGVKAVGATNPCFESAAIAAASKMRFAPALLGGAPTIETGRTATLQFRQ